MFAKKRVMGLLILTTAVFLTACSGSSGDPVEPDEDDVTSQENCSSSVANDPSSSSKKSSVSYDEEEEYVVHKSSSSETYVTTDFLNSEIEYGQFIDTRDNQVYATVVLDGKNWMAQNLNYESREGQSFCYDDNPKNCEKYGRLYTWAAAMDTLTTGHGYGTIETPEYFTQGVCPKGWHVANTGEWNSMIISLFGDSGNSIAGRSLKSTKGWDKGINGEARNGNGTNEIGISIAPAGIRNGQGKYLFLGYAAGFWSTNGSYDGHDSCSETFYSDEAMASSACGGREIARSVRCIADYEM